MIKKKRGVIFWAMFVFLSFIEVYGSVIHIRNKSTEKVDVALTMSGFRTFRVILDSEAARKFEEKYRAPKRISVTYPDGFAEEVKKFSRSKSGKLMTDATNHWTLIIRGKGNYELRRGGPKRTD